MTSDIFRRVGLLALVALLVTSLAAATVAMPAAAQDAEDVQNATADETATPQPVEGHVGPIAIHSWSIVDGTFILEITVEDPTAYAMVDALDGSQQEGMTKPAFKKGTLRSGRQTLRLDVATIDGVGQVTLSTSGGYARISAEALDSGREPVAYGTAQALLFVAVAFAIAGTYRGVKKRYEDENPEARRIL